MTKQLHLYSLRYSTAQGWHAVIEREVSIDTWPEWLKVFRQDEPSVKFTVYHKIPKIWPDDIPDVVMKVKI